MIGGVGRHGRSRRDAKNLAGHLLKGSPKVEILNSAAPDLHAVLADMQLARDASRADAAFLHMYISPSRDMSRDELRQAADIVLQHFGIGEHQAALVFHDKPRVGGEGGSHVHVVVSRVGPDGDVVTGGFEKIRMETAMRLVEHQMGEAPTLGRHHGSAVRWMRQNGHQEAAEWLEGVHGPNPPKPSSMASPDARQGLERRGIDLGTVRGTVLAAWTASDSPKAFAAAMVAEGLTIMPGEKPGVFVVAAGDVEIGALDRIVKQKRREVAARMEGYDHDTAAAEHGRPRDLQARGGGLSEGRELAAPPVAPGGNGEEGRRADRADSDLARNARHVAASDPPVVGGSAQQSRPLERAQAIRQLSQVRLSPDAVKAMQNLQMRAMARPVTRFESLQVAREVEASTGWDRLRDLGQELLDRARRTYVAVVAYRRERRDEERREAAARMTDAEALAVLRQKVQAQRARRDPEPEHDTEDYVYSGPRM